MWASTSKCYLCESNDISANSRYHCDDCEQYKKISSIYGTEIIVKALKEIFIRDTAPIEKRTEVVASSMLTRSKSDKLYNQLKTTKSN